LDIGRKRLFFNIATPRRIDLRSNAWKSHRHEALTFGRTLKNLIATLWLTIGETHRKEIQLLFARAKGMFARTKACFGRIHEVQRTVKKLSFCS
jgi:hypothetical protein